MRKIFIILSFFSFICAKNFVVLDPASVEIFYLLNAQDQISAIAKTDQSIIKPQEKTSKLPSVGTYIKPNLEKIVELKPDFAILSFHSSGVLDDLKRLGIKTLMMKSESLEDIYKNILMIADLVDKKDEAQKIISNFKTKISSYKTDKITNKKVLFFYAQTPLMAFSSKTLPGDIFKIFKMQNLADNLKGQMPIINNEFLLLQNPDFIVFVGESVENLLKQNPILEKTNAAKTGKIFNVKSASLLRGSPYILDEIEKIYNNFLK